MKAMHVSMCAVVVFSASCSAETDGQCFVVGEGGAIRKFPQSGKDICDTLHEHCGDGRAGTLCLKSALEKIVPNHTDSIRSTMRVPLEFYFLCIAKSGHIHTLRSGNTSRVQSLTALLRNATILSASHYPAHTAAALAAQSKYSMASRW